jgi:hypothetical protein
MKYWDIKPLTKQERIHNAQNRVERAKRVLIRELEKTDPRHAVLMHKRLSPLQFSTQRTEFIYVDQYGRVVDRPTPRQGFTLIC